MSTSRMALRLIFLSLEVEPRVATSLKMSAWICLEIYSHYSHQTVATPYFREVRTTNVVRTLEASNTYSTCRRTFVAVEHLAVLLEWSSAELEGD